MSAVAQTLRVARSNLAKRKKGATKPRGRYRKAQDADLAPLIRAIVDARVRPMAIGAFARWRTASCGSRASGP